MQPKRKSQLSSKKVPPPSKFKKERLPFNQLGEAVFEEFTRRLCQIAFPGYERYELKEVRGRSQFGVDAECFNTAGQPETILSAKCYDKTSITPAKIKTWVNDFTKNLEGHWKGKGVRIFVLAITNDGQKSEIDEAVREIKNDLRRLGVNFEIWFNAKLNDYCIKNESLVSEFFGPVWLAEFFPHYGIQLIDTRQGSSSVAQFQETTLSTDDIEKLKASNSSTVEDLIELHLSERRKGNNLPLKSYIEKLIADSNRWNQLPSTLQAKVYRQLVMLYLDEGNTHLAEPALQSARELSDLPDSILPALLAYHTSGIDAALSELNAAKMQTELELKTAFLIEDDKLDAAAEALKYAKNTAEVFRLRSLLELKSNDIEAAVACSSKALELSPESYSVSLSFIQVHLTAALVPGGSIHLGAAANPFYPAIVRQTKEAQNHIAKALAVSRNVVLRSTGNPKKDAQSWMIALLLSSIGNQKEGKELALELATLDDPDPLHVFWSFMIGEQLPLGQIRKKLGDAIRTGVGTPTHLVVLARLSDLDDVDSSASAELIRKHKHRYPEQIHFLEQWEKEFTKTNQASRQLVAAGDFDAANKLTQSISSDQNSSNAEDLLISAEALANGGHWELLNQLRRQLMRYPGPRFFQLAAIAAIRAHDFENATQIVDQAETLFPDCQLPAYFRSLRAQALVGSGNVHDAIEELVALDKLDPQANHKRSIIQSYLELGRTSDAARIARSLAGMSDAEPKDLLFAAHINIDVDPSFSRKVTEQLVASKDLSHETVPHILELQSRIGALREDIQSKLNAAVARFLNSEYVVRIQTVEEALQKIADISEEKRKPRKLWEQGGIISHKAFASWHQTFVELMLANYEGVRSEIGDWHPPIITTSGLPKKSLPEPSGEKLTLALDVSALILAQRFNILEDLSHIFDVRVPRSILPFLSQIIGKWQVRLIESDIELLEQFEHSHSKKIQIVEALPNGQEALNRFYGDEPLPSDLGALIKTLLISEKLTSNQKTKLLALLDLEESQLRFSAPICPKTVYLTGGALLVFILSESLDTVLEQTRVVIARGEFVSLKKAVAMSRQSHLQKFQLQKLQSYAREKLDAGRWALLPSPPCPGMSQADLEGYPDGNLLLASLWEVFNYGTNEPHPMIWIEDRFLGRFNLAHALTLPDILSILAASKTISTERKNAISSKISEDGIGFFPISRELLLSELVKSSRTSTGFLETKQLKRLRVAFGRQAALVRYVDWNEQRTDSRGLIVGELKFAKDIGFMLPWLLRKLWFDTDLDEQQLVSASNWAWQFVRLESIRPTDDPNISNEHRLVMAATILMDCVTLPFICALQSKQKADQKYESYLGWLFSHHLDNRLYKDKDLCEIFVSQLVNLFSAHIDEALPVGDHVHEAVQMHFIREIYNLLERFPDDLREHIWNTGSFAKKVKVQRDFIVYTQVGQFAASKIAESISNAEQNSSLRSTIESEDSDVVASLTVNLDEDGLPDVAISSGGTEIRLSSEAVVLSLKEPLKRLEMFDKQPDLSCRGEMWSAQARAILAKDLSLRERIQQWSELQKNNFVDVLQAAEEQLQSAGTWHRSTLEVPSLAAMLEYTMLNTNTSDVEASFRNSLQKLKQLFGDVEASKRLAAPALLGGFIDSLPITGPGGDFFLNDLIHILQQSTHKHTELFEKSSRSVQHYVCIFVALVRHGSHQILVDDDYIGVPSWVRIFLCWVWADRLTNLLVRRGVDPEGFKKVLNRSENLGLHQALNFNGVDAEFLSSTLEITEGWFNTKLFQAFASKRNDALDINMDRCILDLIGTTKDKSVVPSAIHLFAPSPKKWPETAYESISELIGRKLIPVFPDLIAISTDEMPSIILSNIDNSDDPVSWLGMLSLSQPGALSTQYLEAVLPHLENEIISFGAKDFPEPMIVLLRLYGRITGETGNSAKFRQMIPSLVRQRFSENDLPELGFKIDRNRPEILFELLFDAAATHVQNLSIPIGEKIAILKEILEVILDVWPSSSLAMQVLLTNLVDILPVKLSSPIWSMITSTRSFDC